MAMMISKFHRLIQSRVVWSIILVVVVISFVGLYIRLPGSSAAAREATSPGKLEGKSVPAEEFRKAYVNTYLSVAMMLGRAPDTDRIDEQLRAAAWQRLAALRQADELGLEVSDGQVVATIQSHPGFSVEGRFSEMHYNNFVFGTLRRMGITERQFEEHVREEIALQMLRRMLDQSVLVSPYELKRTFSTLTDIFDIEYAGITTNDVKDDVKVSDEDVQACFNEDPAAFTIPEKVKVKYVAVPVSNFVDQVELEEDDAEMYYDENTENYTETVLVTNDWAASDLIAGGETNEPMVEEKEIIRPFEEVKDEIAAELIAERARSLAVDRATDLVVELAPDRQGESLAFEDAAAKYGLEVRSLEPFALDEEVEGIDAGFEFNRAAFECRPGPEEYFSDAIAGTSAVYVAAIEERFDARVPELDEVREAVRAEAEVRALIKALGDKARAVNEAATETIAKGGTFADAVRKQGLEPAAITNIAATSETEDIAYGDYLLRAVLVRNQGEVADPVTTDDDVVLVAYVARRQPGDTSSFGALRPQIVNMLRRDRGRILFDDWQAYLLASAAFEERKATEPEDAEAVEEAEEAMQDVVGDLQ